MATDSVNLIAQGFEANEYNEEYNEDRFSLTHFIFFRNVDANDVFVESQADVNIQAQDGYRYDYIIGNLIRENLSVQKRKFNFAYAASNYRSNVLQEAAQSDSRDVLTPNHVGVNVSDRGTLTSRFPTQEVSPLQYCLRSKW